MPQNLEAIAATLREQLPDGHRITRIQQLSDGYSNETYLVEGLDLILRLPPMGNSLLAPFGAHGVLAQSRILQEYASRPAAPPVPGMVHTECDPTVLGSVFFLMQRVNFDAWGDWGPPMWFVEADSAFRSGIAEQFVATYAKLHLLEPLAALGPPLSNREELCRWGDPIQHIDNRALTAAIACLLEIAPNDAAPAPCHGDAKPANILWKDGRIVAVIDHEMSFNGDPRFDLGSLLQAFETMKRVATSAREFNGFWDRAQLIAEWEARTGRSAGDIVWFEAASRVRYAAILTYGYWLFTQGDAVGARFGTLGPTLERMSQSALDLAQDYGGKSRIKKAVLF